MGLLNRLAISSNDKAREYATELRNSHDSGKHNSFNSALADEVAQKLASLPKAERIKAARKLGLI